MKQGGCKEDPYQMLGVDRHSTPAQVRAAYLRLAKANHPDMQGDAASMARLNGAYEQVIQQCAAGGGATLKTRVRKAAATPSSPKLSGVVPIGCAAFVSVLGSAFVLWSLRDPKTDTWRPNGLLEPPDNPCVRVSISTCSKIYIKIQF